MFFYWRIQQDLSCLGEYLIFRDPGLSRYWQAWMRRNAAGIVLAEDWGLDSNDRSHLN